MIFAMNKVKRMNDATSFDFSFPEEETKSVSSPEEDTKSDGDGVNFSPVTLVPISWLKAHERVVSQDRILHLKQDTLSWGEYRLPLLVDKQTGAILDGHHRHAVGFDLGLSHLPVILVDYLNDSNIQVGVWPKCGISNITKEQVIQMSLSNNVFPPKTSRHYMVNTHMSLPTIHVPLHMLRKDQLTIDQLHAGSQAILLPMQCCFQESKSEENFVKSKF